MITANWEYVKKRIEDKIKGWQGRCLTEIGKAVLVKTVIMPIIAFTGSIIKLPDDTEKALTSIIFGFIWGKTTEYRFSLWVRLTKSPGHLPIKKEEEEA